MGSHAPKTVADDVAAALAAFAAAGGAVTKVAPDVASNLRKTKYVGRGALKGSVAKPGHAPDA